MKAIKIISALCITFIFLQCASTNFEKQPPFKISSATYNNWIGGLPGVRGTKVEIHLSQKNQITFDSLFFKNSKTKIEKKEVKGEIILIGHFNTQRNQDIILDANPIKELKNKIPKPDKFPFDLKKNEAVISYQLKGKTKYFKVKDIQKQDSDSFSIKQ